LASFTIALSAIVKSFSTVKAFYGVGPSTSRPTPTWRARVSVSVWIITFDMSGMGDLTSSYATASIALRIVSPRKPHHYVKVRILHKHTFSFSEYMMGYFSLQDLFLSSFK
jgi:hypothetical protein